MKALSISVLLTIAAGCASTQQPVQFRSMRSVQASVDIAAKALNRQGLRTVRIDPESGVIHTAWRDTNMIFGKIAGVPATLVQRYTVIIRPQYDGAEVLVRADVRRCMLGLGTRQGGHACEDFDIQLSGDQEALDRLGARLQEAIRAASGGSRIGEGLGPAPDPSLSATGTVFPGFQRSFTLEAAVAKVVAAALTSPFEG